MTPEERTTAIVAAAAQRIIAATAANLSDFRTELTIRLDSLRAELTTRLDTIERRTGRIDLNLHAVMLQTAGMSKSLSQAEALDSSFAATLAAQQRAIDDLYAQLAALKRQPPAPSN